MGTDCQIKYRPEQMIQINHLCCVILKCDAQAKCILSPYREVSISDNIFWHYLYDLISICLTASVQLSLVWIIADT